MKYLGILYCSCFECSQSISAFSTADTFNTREYFRISYCEVQEHSQYFRVLYCEVLLVRVLLGVFYSNAEAFRGLPDAYHRTRTLIFQNRTLWSDLCLDVVACALDAVACEGFIIGDHQLFAIRRWGVYGFISLTRWGLKFSGVRLD